MYRKPIALKENISLDTQVQTNVPRSRGENWRPERILYVLRAYVKENTHRPPANGKGSEEEFKFINEYGKEEKITYGELYKKCTYFLKKYKNTKEEEYKEKNRDAYTEISSLWDSLERNQGEDWQLERILYVLRGYVKENTNKPTQSSKKEFKYIDEKGKEETITCEELNSRCRGFLRHYENSSEEYREKYKDEYAEISSLWDSLDGNKGEDWQPEKMLYALREYVKENTHRPPATGKGSEEEFKYINEAGEEETVTYKKLSQKCFSFLINYKKSSKEYQEENKSIYEKIQKLWAGLSRANTPGEKQPYTGAVYPHANKSDGSDHTGDAANPSGLTPSRAINEYTSSGKRGIAFLRKGRKADLKDLTNIFNPEKFGADNAPRHARVDIVDNNVSRMDIERGLYVFTRYLDIVVNTLTDFDTPRNQHNRKYPNPQERNRNPKWRTLEEAANFVLRLADAKIIQKQERDALLAAYDAARAETQKVAAQGLAENDLRSWPACAAYLEIVETLTQKYNAALFDAYLKVLKDRSAELRQVLQYAAGQIKSNFGDDMAYPPVVQATARLRRIYFWLGLIQNGVLDSAESYGEYYEKYRQELARHNAGLPMLDLRRIISANLPARRERVIRLIRRGLWTLGSAARKFLRDITQEAERLIIAPKFPNPVDRVPVF